MGWPESKVRVALAASAINEIPDRQARRARCRDGGALPWAVKDFVTDPVLQLAMDCVDLPTLRAARIKRDLRAEEPDTAGGGCGPSSVATLAAIVSDGWP